MQSEHDPDRSIDSPEFGDHTAGIPKGEARSTERFRNGHPKETKLGYPHAYRFGNTTIFIDRTSVHFRRKKSTDAGNQ
jgi:hypothetical protein